MDRKRGSEPSDRTWTVLFVLAVVAILDLARPVLVPFALAVLLTFVVTPIVARVERRIRSRAVAVAIVTIALIGVFTGGALVIGQQFLGFADELPAYRDTIVRKIRTIQRGPGSLLGRTAETVRGIGQEIARDPAGTDPSDPTVTPAPPAAREAPAAEVPAAAPTTSAPEPPQLVWAILRPLAEPLSSGAIVILLLVIMLMSRESIRDRLIRLAGLRQIGLTTQMLGEAGVRVGSYLRAQLLINTVYGVSVGVGLLIIGIPSAALCGLFAGVSRFIPIVGPWFGAAIPAALALAAFDDWNHVLMVGVLFASLEILTNIVFEPWLYGSSTGLSSFGVVVAIIFWTWVWGGVGLVLAVPMTACLMVFARQVPRLGALAILLGDEPVLADSMRFYQRLLCKDDDEAAAILAAASNGQDPAEALDSVVINGLAATRADRRRGLITASQAAEIASAAGDITSEWLADSFGDPGSPVAAPASDPRVVCIPLDEIDEAAALGLAGLLQREGVDTEVASAALLLAEQIDLAAAPGVGVIAVCSVGESMPRQAVRICKALNRRVPQRPVLIVAWDRDLAGQDRPTKGAAAPYASVDSSRSAVSTALALLGTSPAAAA